ncbi:AT-hook motif nuclear-localized protein 1 [Andrographis paniculata]|uniref:AT-hook motif nuclear-localized protein 1 n=1 Tax=Andrographis paniculata TaxID=175694 RepID=UPI0021E87670|nr:AT-hook motif nuclear-localized protein 1 [Andrographis paniculata]
MEENEGLTGVGVTVRGEEVPQSFRVQPRAENSGGGGAVGSSISSEIQKQKKKRGRPRKYAGDGAIVALSPSPISSSIPFATTDFPSWKQTSGRPADQPLKKKHKLEFGKGRSMANSGGSFIPHLITINAGEDIMMKIVSFSQQESRAICVLAANGSVSNVTLRQPNSSGGTLTYEGRFEILSLRGSFMPNNNATAKSRSGGMSVSLAGPDGRVLGGGLSGMLLAAGPVQVVIGSFLPGSEIEPKTKKPKFDPATTFAQSPVAPLPIPTTTPAPFLAAVNSNHGLLKTADTENSNHDIKC